MNSFVYLYKRTIINRIKKALRKPITYIYIVFIVAYAFFAFAGMSTGVKGVNIDSPENMAIVLSLIVFFMIPANIISYSKRKGLLFRPSEVHFLFPSPCNPKHVILYAGFKSFVISFVIGIFLLIFGTTTFHMPLLNMILYFLVFVVLENIMEGSLMILCYGNETLPDWFFKVINIILYALMAVFAGVAMYLIITEGFKFTVLHEYLSLPVIQLIPIVGWNISIIQLLFIGPTTINIICAVLYCISTLIFFLLARKMKCTGEYYEDAMKFADHYEEVRSNQKKGVVVLSNKKTKFKKAEVEYKGAYAKAIYYRQVLEYKKSRFFIFGWHTLLAFAIGVGIAVISYFADAAAEMGVSKLFVIPAVIAYIIFIFSSYATKWSKELENPYTYLIPDSNIKKIWYATKMEHVKAIVDGILITVPGAIVLKLTPLQTILIVALYVCLSANKLYYSMLSDAIIGTLLGQFGRSILKMLFQAIVITIAIIGAVIAGIFISIEAGFAVMIAITVVLSAVGALLASGSFERMESLN